jgi:hypothetical protein
MTDPTRTVVHIDVEKQSNTIEVTELLRALRDFASRQADPGSVGASAVALRRTEDLIRVQDLAAQLADLVEQIPDFPLPDPRLPPAGSAAG